MIRSFSLRTGLAVLSTTALIALSPAASALADGPDFSSCPDQGQARGQCIAQIAQDAQNDQANNAGNNAADSARDIVEACQDKAGSGEGIGDCVSAAVQALHDTGDEHAADVAAKAQDLGGSAPAGSAQVATAPGQRGPEGRPGNQGHPGGRGS